MEKEIIDLSQKLRNDFEKLRTEVSSYIAEKTGVKTLTVSNHFGKARWTFNTGKKRIVLDLYATGQIVFEFQEQLNDNDQEVLDTSKDYLEPDMKPRSDNFFNIYVEGQLDKLIYQMKEHFELVNV